MATGTVTKQLLPANQAHTFSASLTLEKTIIKEKKHYNNITTTKQIPSLLLSLCSANKADIYFCKWFPVLFQIYPIPIWFSSGRPERLSVAITTAIDTNPDEINQSSSLFAPPPPPHPSPSIFPPPSASRANSISAAATEKV